MGVSTLFVTTANTETLNGTVLGVIVFGGRNKSYAKSIRFATNTSLGNVITQTK